MSSVQIGAIKGKILAPADIQEKLPELPVSAHENFVTRRGLGQLHARLADAESRLADLAPDALLERDYLERHARWLRSRIEGAIPVDVRDGPRDRVAFGATVEVLGADHRRSRYRIVGEDEADADRGLLSWVSPFARAMAGARIGDRVAWQRADGDLEVEVAGIDFGNDTPA